MYFITERTSKTGLKFTEVVKKMKEVRETTIKFAKKHGFKSWRPGHFTVVGGISSIEYLTPPDLKVWKKVNENEYMPRLNSKKGKEIRDEMKALPSVHPNDLNGCIGFDQMWSTIGFNQGNKKYYGISVKEEWDIKMPKDCKEITTTEYKKLFKI